jgi:hypothetical protein
MTISVVQSKNINGAWSGSFSSNVTAANTVFLFAFQYNGSGAMSSNSPLFGGSAASGASKLFDVQDSGHTVYSTVWMLPNLAGGAASVALTNVNGTVDANVGMAAIEVSGLGSAPALDSGASPNPETGSGATGTVDSGATGNITSAPELIVSASIVFGQNPGTPSPWTTLQPSGFCTAAWQIVTSSGSPYEFTGNADTAAWCSGIAAVQTGSGGTPHTSTPSLTVTPSFAVKKAEAHVQAMTVTPAFAVKKAEAHVQSLTVTPAFSVTDIKNFGKGGTPDRHHRRSWNPR